MSIVVSLGAKMSVSGPLPQDDSSQDLPSSTLPLHLNSVYGCLSLPFEETDASCDRESISALKKDTTCDWTDFRLLGSAR